MRLVDVSAAAAIGLLTLAVLAAWSPVPLEEASHQYLRQASLGDYLRNIALEQGLPWLQDTDTGALCSALAGYSNSTLIISAISDGHPCAAQPVGAEFRANLTIDVGASRVNLQAWQVAGR